MGGKRRSSGSMPGFYTERVKRMLRLIKEYSLLKHGDRILELGTGWLHWEAITLRLFFEVEAVLYDVWDNRQLGGLLNYMRQLKAVLRELDLSPTEFSRADSLIDQILTVKSFDELYKLLGFTYVVDSQGSLSRFRDESFQLVVSAGVLEHVFRDAVPTLIAETHRILQPGGWAVHSIDTSDHLAHYDLSVSRKRYLSYPEWLWRGLFQNHVQYINRIQRSEWLELFRNNRFELVEEEFREIDISKLKLSNRFSAMDQRDLKCTVIKVTLRK